MASKQVNPDGLPSQRNYRWVFKRHDSWIEDQWRGDNLIFPFACYLSMAIEAFAQIVGPARLRSKRAITLRDITFYDILILSDLHDEGNLHPFAVCMVPKSDNTSWDFEIRAGNKKPSTVRAKGVIGFSDDFSPPPLKKIAFDRAFPMEKKEDDIYQRLRKLGLDYQETFASLSEVYRPRTNGARQALGLIRRPRNDKQFFRPNSFRVNHIVLDALLQIGVIAASGHALDKVETMLPNYIERLDIYHKRLAKQKAGRNLIVRAVAEVLGGGVFSTDAKLLNLGQDFQLIKLTGICFLSVPKFTTALNTVAILRNALSGNELADVHYAQHMDSIFTSHYAQHLDSIFISRFMADGNPNEFFTGRQVSEKITAQNPDLKFTDFDCARFSPEKSYVMVGCCGALGRVMCKFMAQRGARSFVFLCHSKDERRKGARWAKQVLEEHRGTATYRVIESRENSKRIKRSKRALEKISPGIDGAVFAPVLHHDKPFQDLSPEAWQEVIESEATYVDSLHMLLNDMGVFAVARGFPLMLDHTCTLFGVPGGGNLCAMSANRKGSARHLRTKSRPAKAISICLGVPVRKMTSVVRQPDYMWSEIDHEALYEDPQKQVAGEHPEKPEEAQAGPESSNKRSLIPDPEGSADQNDMPSQTIEEDVPSEYIETFDRDPGLKKVGSLPDWQETQDFLDRSGLFPHFSKAIDQTCEKLANHARNKRNAVSNGTVIS